jgi:hypothetical protein
VSHPKQADIEALLTALVDGGVEFIVVGDVAAVLHGAPTTTQDLDIVHRRAADNAKRFSPCFRNSMQSTAIPRDVFYHRPR